MTTYEDVDVFDLMKHMTIQDAIKLSLTDRRAYLISQTDMFWRYFLKRDYPLFVLNKDEDLQSAYRKIYSNKDVKKVTMKLGETFEQFKYHQNIHTFHCSNIQLTSLVGCPVNVIKLRCYDNRLTSLIGCPASVKILYCNSNRLTSLIGCPESVQILTCQSNVLTSLVGCPESVKELYCHDNQLTSLVGCSMNVELLRCHSNQLTSLVGCPANVKILDCSDNQLQTLLIYLPEIEYIIYGNNPLIPPWNQYSKEQIMDIMRNPVYHAL